MTVSANSDPRTAAISPELMPQVELPRPGIPVWLFGLLAAFMAVALFVLLEARRQASADSADGPARQISLAEPPPPLSLPQPAPLRPPAYRELRVARLESPQPSAPPGPAPRYNPPAPAFRPVQPIPGDDPYALVRPPRGGLPTMQPVSGGSGGGSGGIVFDGTVGKGASVNGGGDAVAENDDTVRATIIRNRSSVVQQGVIIPAVLETPLNSDRPGLARAIVSSDVRSFDGTRVLIPRGSRLIGEFKADTNPGVRRILVTWGRLIRPDGVAIRLDSPASDSLGGSGVPGRVNTHFFERFASAVLQSALTIGVNVASQAPNNGSNIYVGLPGQAAQLGQDLLPDSKRPPTIKVKAGAQIAIFVAHDLDFGGTLAVR